MSNVVVELEVRVACNCLPFPIVGEHTWSRRATHPQQWKKLRPTWLYFSSTLKTPSCAKVSLKIMNFKRFCMRWRGSKQRFQEHWLSTGKKGCVVNQVNFIKVFFIMLYKEIWNWILKCGVCHTVFSDGQLNQETAFMTATRGNIPKLVSRLGYSCCIPCFSIAYIHNYQFFSWCFVEQLDNSGTQNNGQLMGYIMGYLYILTGHQSIVFTNMTKENVINCESWNDGKRFLVLVSTLYCFGGVIYHRLDFGTWNICSPFLVSFFSRSDPIFSGHIQWKLKG